MKENADFVIREILDHEGGFVDHPDDPGGATNKGITIGTYRRFINPKGTVADLKAMTTAQAVKVYREQYWDAVGGDDLPSGVDYTTVDFAVNSGPSRAAKYLQRAIGVIDDGAVGPQTIAASKSAVAFETIDKVNDRRLAFMRRIDGGMWWKTFGGGSKVRVARVRKNSMKLAVSGNVTKPKLTPPRDEPTTFLGAIFAALFGRRK